MSAIQSINELDPANLGVILHPYPSE